MLDNRGHIHLFAIAGVALAIMIAYAVVMKMNGERNASQTVLYDRPGGASTQAIPEEQQIANILYAAADTQSRMLRIKVDCILLSWDSIDQKSKKTILESFKKETEKHHDKVSKFYQRFNSPQWQRLSAAKRGKHLADLVESITNEQKDPIRFIDDYSASIASH
jgi:hypothetical protein